MAGLGNNLIVFAYKSAGGAGLIWEKDVKVIPNNKVTIIKKCFSSIKLYFITNIIMQV